MMLSPTTDDLGDPTGIGFQFESVCDDGAAHFTAKLNRLVRLQRCKFGWRLPPHPSSALPQTVVYSLLWMKQNKPIEYAASLELGRRYATAWDDPVLKPQTAQET
jgi:hypothetical protein